MLLGRTLHPLQVFARAVLLAIIRSAVAPQIAQVVWLGHIWPHQERQRCQAVPIVLLDITNRMLGRQAAVLAQQDLTVKARV